MHLAKVDPQPIVYETKIKEEHLIYIHSKYIKGNQEYVSKKTFEVMSSKSTCFQIGLHIAQI